MSKAVDKIENFLKFGSHLGLERMELLLNKLGNPEKKLQVIHVAGTNGKGSICKYIYSVLEEEGYRTGLYISPFLEEFNERIQFDGSNISQEDLEIYTDKVVAVAETLVDEGFDSPTEFEIVTAIALLYFFEKEADIVILEVGLGGKGDSTNVIKKPLLTIIGEISYDHTDRLGSTLEEIAGEKAGIIKKNCPLIVGISKEEAFKVVEKKAIEKSAALINAYGFNPVILERNLGGTRIKGKVFKEEYLVDLSLLSLYQIDNGRIALVALEYLKENGIVDLKKESIVNGLKNAIHHGRFEVISENPYVIIDGAHNEAGSLALEESLKFYFPNKKILFVLGILEDKDINKIIGNLIEVSKDFIVTVPNNLRGANTRILAKVIKEKGGSPIEVPQPLEAVNEALSKIQEYDVLVFAGSLYLIGEIRGILIGELSKGGVK